MGFTFLFYTDRCNEEICNENSGGKIEMSAVQRGAANQSQKLMVFVLTMALYGLATLFTELIPSFQVGIVEFSVEYSCSSR